MITLGIETSGREGSIALLNDGERLGQRDLSREGRRHARTLIAELQGLLFEAQLTPADVETIAVSLGPGSFTGLRVGVTCAKTWAFATGCRIVGVNTLLAIAERSTAATETLHVISDAQRGELFVGRFIRPQEGHWKLVEDITIVNTEQWLDSLSTMQTISGTAVDQLRDRIPSGVPLEVAERCHPRAEEIASLGQRQCNTGSSDDAWRLEPLYLRRSAAEEKAEQTPDSIDCSSRDAD